MIVILDYGMGNSSSILNMIRKVGGDARISVDSADLETASAFVLPGVGAFDNGMQKLNDLGLVEVLRRKVCDQGTPFLGVCLGMQLLFEGSDEGELSGLGWLKGSVRRFDFSEFEDKSRLKVPHMGWNQIKPVDYSNLFAGLEEEARFYFVHSFYVECENPEDILANCTYGIEFPCAVHKANIWGAQFHAEKSHKYGMALFRNFLSEVRHS